MSCKDFKWSGSVTGTELTFVVAARAASSRPVDESSGITSTIGVILPTSFPLSNLISLSVQFKIHMGVVDDRLSSDRSQIQFILDRL